MADPGVDRTDARDQLSISMGPLLAHVCEHPMPGPKLWGILPHGCIVLQLAQRHSGTGWLENDRIFRRHAASDPSIPWNVLNPSLMAATVLTTSPAGLGNSICPHCQAADHRRPVISGPVPSATVPTCPPKSRYTPYGNPGANEPCRMYNRGVCPDSASTCRYRHVCSNPDCMAPGHTAPNCLSTKTPTARVT